MRDHGRVEKAGRLASALSLDGQPDSADPDVGALGAAGDDRGHDFPQATRSHGTERAACPLGTASCTGG